MVNGHCGSNDNLRGPQQRPPRALHLSCSWTAFIRLSLNTSKSELKKKDNGLVKRCCICTRQECSWQWAGTEQETLHQSWSARQLPPGWASQTPTWSSPLSSSSWAPCSCQSPPQGRWLPRSASSSERRTCKSWRDFFQTVQKYFFLYSFVFARFVIKYLSVFVLRFQSTVKKIHCNW